MDDSLIVDVLLPVFDDGLVYQQPLDFVGNVRDDIQNLKAIRLGVSALAVLGRKLSQLLIPDCGVAHPLVARLPGSIRADTLVVASVQCCIDDIVCQQVQRQLFFNMLGQHSSTPPLIECLST